jgi:hypothetical protein
VELDSLNQDILEEVLQHYQSATRFLLSQLHRGPPTSNQDQASPQDYSTVAHLSSLAQIAQKIQGLSVPDSLAQTSSLQQAPSVHNIDWQQLITGGEEPAAQSHIDATVPEATWDVDPSWRALVVSLPSVEYDSLRTPRSRGILRGTCT